MLVLSRLPGQKILIGDPASPLAVVSVELIHGEQVKLGVEVSREIPVHREEVAAKILKGIKSNNTKEGA